MNNLILKLRESIIVKCTLNPLIPPLTHYWKSMHYKMIAEDISFTLEKTTLISEDRKRAIGTTLSEVTLKRFFDEQYTNHVTYDQRFINTLDKICIFLGFKDRDSFMTDTVKATPIKDYNEKQIDDGFYKKLVMNYCKEEFESLGQLPLINLDKLSAYIFKDGPLYSRILNIYQKHSEKKIFLNKSNNRSNMEILFINITNLDAHEVVIDTKEYWNLEWITENGETAFFYHKMNSQVYFLKNINQTWKIWDNYNPDFQNLQNTITDLDQIKEM